MDNGGHDTDIARGRNVRPALFGLVVAAVVVAVFAVQLAVRPPASPPSARPTAAPVPVSSTVATSTQSAAPLSPTSEPSATSLFSLTPTPTPTPSPLPSLDESVEPPTDYAECVAYYEARGYNSDNCPDSKVVASLSAFTASALADPSRDPRLAINSPPAGCERSDLDLPGVFVCDGTQEDFDRDGDAYVDSITSYIPPDWSVDGDIDSIHDQDCRGLAWPGGVVEIMATSVSGGHLAVWVTDEYGEVLHDSAAGATRLRVRLKAGRYGVFVGPAGGSPKQVGKYRLTLRARAG